MKYDKKEPETMDADPMRLLVSAILAFTVMLFINGFVGSMGGFPAFVAFTLVFFRIRTRAGMENGGMQQELSDRQITGRLFWWVSPLKSLTINSNNDENIVCFIR